MSVKSLSLQTLLLFSSLSSILARVHPRAGGIAWGNCTEAELAAIQCANFSVPLDYSDPDSDATLSLQVARLPALQGPRKGSVFLNFGGPGLETRTQLATTGVIFQALTGGQYDLVTFDPRGTANTITASCFNTTIEREQIVGEPSSVIPSTEDGLALGRLWGQTQVVANSCFDFPGFQQRGSVLGTTFVARDIMQLIDFIEDDGLLRYYGLSYGTVLGATVAAMFPDRIDRMVLDGILNPHEYFNDYDIEVWADSDKTLAAVLNGCVEAGKELCPLASRSDNGSDLLEEVSSLLEELRIEPLVADTLLIDSSLLETYIRFSLYSNPYTNFTVGLEALLSGNTTAFAAAYAQFLGQGLDLSALQDESPFAILCGDKKLPELTFTEMTPVFEAFEEQSRFIGTSGFVQAMICQNWQIEAKERYEGTFNVSTRHPILAVGNTYDVATPLVSARNISASFQNGVLLENEGFGHTSIAHGSTCTINALRAYFQNGTLPEDGTRCEVDYAPFDASLNIGTLLVSLGYL
ncbi:alpha/beta hydrolase [Aspergillus stella-maris]|uniref:alpha/beta hydrolase n=1 Tax=Aspergillus stella-maris TaxID=1810926 RepID=UPI003CCCB73B